MRLFRQTTKREVNSFYYIGIKLRQKSRCSFVMETLVTLTNVIYDISTIESSYVE